MGKKIYLLSLLLSLENMCANKNVGWIEFFFALYLFYQVSSLFGPNILDHPRQCLMAHGGIVNEPEVKETFIDLHHHVNQLFQPIKINI